MIAEEIVDDLDEEKRAKLSAETAWTTAIPMTSMATRTR